MATDAFRASGWDGPQHERRHRRLGRGRAAVVGSRRQSRRPLTRRRRPSGDEAAACVGGQRVPLAPSPLALAGALLARALLAPQPLIFSRCGDVAPSAVVADERDRPLALRAIAPQRLSTTPIGPFVGPLASASLNFVTGTSGNGVEGRPQAQIARDRDLADEVDVDQPSQPHDEVGQSAIGRVDEVRRAGRAGRAAAASPPCRCRPASGICRPGTARGCTLFSC